MSTIALENLPQHRPLWELHIIKYPTSNAMGTLVFKLHHALGDGFSLMGALLSCMERADKTSLPFTFPSSQRTKSFSNTNVVFKRLPSIFSLAFRTISDFGWSLLKSNLIEDDQTPIRSCAEDSKLRHMKISNVTFSLDQIRKLKSKLGVVSEISLKLVPFTFDNMMFIYKFKDKLHFYLITGYVWVNLIRKEKKIFISKDKFMINLKINFLNKT